MRKYIQYRVAGKAASFPMDMLRYDHSWPATTDDAITITGAYSGDIPPSHRIEILLTGLTCHSDRWLSFGWVVMQQIKVEGNV